MARWLVTLALALAVGQGSLAAPAAKPRKRRRAQPVPLPGKLILEEDFEKGIDAWQSRVVGKLEWVQNPKQARKGKGCVMGSVQADRKANFLERKLTFQTTSIYRFVIWARADRVGKLVLWSQKGKTRRMLGSWRDVNRRWRPLQCQFSVPESGEWQFQVVLPSSHGAAPCTMWVDEARLFETPLSPSVQLTKDEGYCSEPRLVADGSGGAWLSWLAFHEGQDKLWVSRLEREGKCARIAERWPVPLPGKSHVLGSRLVRGQDGAWLVYAAEVKGNWDVYACRVRAKGLDQPVRVTTDPAVDAKPCAVVHRGELWVAWESNRDGARQLYLKPLSTGAPRCISQPGVNSYSPALESHEGALHLVWHAYVDGNYDLYGRRAGADGAGGSVRRLTQDGSIDRHAQLQSCGNGLWLVWQRETVGARNTRITTRNYRTGVVTKKLTMLCRWEPQGLAKAAGVGQTILAQGTEAPALTADGQGRIWVTARRARGKSLGWDSVLQCFAGEEWSEPRHVSSAVGWDGHGAVALVGDQALVAYQVGRTPAFKDFDAAQEAKSDIHVGTVPLSVAPQAAAPRLEPLADDPEPHWLAGLRKQLGELGPKHSIEYKGKTLHLLWGDLHEHSSLSQCNRWKDMGPDDSYAHERDVIRADFTCLTDHGYNFCPGLWSYLSKIVRVNHDPGRFVAFLGEEWTSTIEKYSDEHPEGYYGHRNLVFSSPYFPRWFNAKDETTPRQLWDQLAKMQADSVTIPHQLADTGNVPTDWNFTDEVAQPVAEIFQARQSYEHKGAPRQAQRTIEGHFIQDAWAKGIVIGVIASPDHGGGQGKAAVYAESLTREAILDALRMRRCYGTTAARVFLDVRVNRALMGEKITAKAGQPVTVNVKVIAANDIAQVELCRSNAFIYAKPGDGREMEFEFTDTKPVAGKSYYYVRVQQKDEELAWSSPVWVDAR